MENETWKPVIECPDIYLVSDLGRVKRIGRSWGATAGRVLKQNPDSRGYMRVCLSVKGKRYTRPVHILVVQAFLGPIPDGMQVNHIDADKANNTKSNLEVVTRQENVSHAQRYGLIGSEKGRPRRKISNEQVLEIRQLSRDGETRPAMAEKYGVSLSTIDAIVNYRSRKDVA